MAAGGAVRVGVVVAVGCPGPGLVGRRVGAWVGRGVGEGTKVPGPTVAEAVGVGDAVGVNVQVGVAVPVGGKVEVRVGGMIVGVAVGVVSGDKVSPGRGVTVATGVCRPVCRVAR